jgi:hypothetical protein
MPALMILQQNFDRGSQSIPPWTIPVFIAVIAAIVVYNLVKNNLSKQNPSRTAGFAPKPQVQAKPPAFSATGFRRFGKELGLTGEEIAFLEGYGKKLQMSNPEHTMRNPQAMDEFLKRVYQEIEAHSESQALADQRGAVLFKIRERIEKSRATSSHIESTHSLPAGLAFTFITPDGDHYTSRISATSPEGMACAVPHDGFAQELRFRRGARLTCFFYLGSQNGYTFETKIQGYSTLGNANVMVVKHSEKVHALPAREHKRRTIAEPCDFCPVTIVVSKNGKKAVLGKRSYPGQISDISAGGLSLKTANPLEQNEYLKIDFMSRHGKLSAIGQVVHMNRLKGSGGIMHIQFARVARQDLNKILSMVYGYGE